MTDTLQCSLKGLGCRKPQQTLKQNPRNDSPHELMWNSPHVRPWLTEPSCPPWPLDLVPLAKGHRYENLPGEFTRESNLVSFLLSNTVVPKRW